MGKKIVGAIFAAISFVTASMIGGIVLMFHTLGSCDEPRAIYYLPMVYYYGAIAVAALVGGLFLFLAFFPGKSKE